jgi:quercetin dioxygenase-like cupin family protein
VEPRVHPRGGGETLADRPERWVAAKVEHELMDITESRYAPGERGPDPHVHRKHADAFYVLDGELVFGLGPEGSTRVRGTAGTFVLVPAGVIHTFGNESDADARFLNIHAPGMGFVESLRARRDGRHADADRFDQLDPPADGGRSIADAVVRGPGEGHLLEAGASRAIFKAEVSDGDGTFSLLETTLAPDFPGPLLHVHERHVDSFFVLDGTLTLTLASAASRVEAPAGSFAVVPPGNPHTFGNPSGAPVRMLNLMAPAGFEQYLKDMAASTTPGEAPDPQTMAAIASRYDFVPQ